MKTGILISLVLVSILVYQTRQLRLCHTENSIMEQKINEHTKRRTASYERIKRYLKRELHKCSPQSWKYSDLHLGLTALDSLSKLQTGSISDLDCFCWLFASLPWKHFSNSSWPVYTEERIALSSNRATVRYHKADLLQDYMIALLERTSERGCLIDHFSFHQIHNPQSNEWALYFGAMADGYRHITLKEGTINDHAFDYLPLKSGIDTLRFKVEAYDMETDSIHTQEYLYSIKIVGPEVRS